ncbi:hypothetical protein B0T25DRAFT_572133 [Lasiosphaeria hispida]|uniref:Uncharacterized protein n=1 Tax=Lasiosphaeria hispida TaxID=260671 RepID=A0AAJ0HCF7_9PEZI|nr:hypothetical protein B0T25DRAFT_572133 [Lasiosphaeria hispida]
MASVYADHPFKLLETPTYRKTKNGGPIRHTGIDSVMQEMCHVHNMLLRGLNSIYLQALHVAAADERNFARVAGVMDGNVAQHHQFEAGLDAFGDYAQAVLAGTDKYGGARIVAMTICGAKIVDTGLAESEFSAAGMIPNRYRT